MKDDLSQGFTQTVRQKIEDEIVQGVLVPGMRLDEVGLAERFNVSRTPVREALLQLGAVGLVEIRPRRGAVVRYPSIRDVIEMFEAMAEMEASCGMFAARRHTLEDLAAIKAGLDGCAAAASQGDDDAYFSQNVIFHMAIFMAAHNGFLAEQANSLQRRLAPLRRMQLRFPKRMASSLAEHRKIYEAIAASDPDVVARLLRAHIVLQGEKFNNVVASLPQSYG